MTTGSRPRVFMRDRLTIGQRWQRRIDGRVFTVRQIYRATRHVLLADDHGRLLVEFAELRTRWTQLPPVDDSRAAAADDPRGERDR